MIGACSVCGLEVAVEGVGVRTVCAGCGAYLHCCRSCELFRPGLRNDCREPRTEPVADKEALNFCDDFRLAPRRAPVSRSSEARAELDRLFRRS